MSIPSYEALMLPVLHGAAKGMRRVPELADEVAAELGLSVEDAEALLPSGRQRILHNRLHWAKFYLTKAGLIEVPVRGVFTATPEGRMLLEKKPAKIGNDTLLAYPGFQGFLHGQKGGQDGAAVEAVQADEMTPEERIEQSALALDQIVRGDLIEKIASGSPAFFEGMIVDLLVAMGYGGSHADAAKRIGKSGDGGIDGVISEDRLGLDRIYIQAKRYAAGNVVGRPEIQSFVGSLVGLGATKGVFVTTSTFSQHARGLREGPDPACRPDRRRRVVRADDRARGQNRPNRRTQTGGRRLFHGGRIGMASPGTRNAGAAARPVPGRCPSTRNHA